MYQPLAQSPLPRQIRRQVPVTWTYLGEDETGYVFLEGFFDDIGNMFKRMVKITPKSFTPGNIYKGFVNTTLTVASGGIYQFLPKGIKKTVYEVGKVAIPVVGGAVFAAMNPVLMGSITSKLGQAASILGKNASTIGGAVFGFLNKMPPAQQAQVAEQLTPQQIAQIEQGYVPPEVQAMMNQAARQAYYPPAPPMSVEQAYGAPAPEGSLVTQAGMAGDNTMLIFIGLSAVGLVLFGMPGRRR
jgi:hypothetical protein